MGRGENVEEMWMGRGKSGRGRVDGQRVECRGSVDEEWACAEEKPVAAAARVEHTNSIGMKWADSPLHIGMG